MILGHRFERAMALMKERKAQREQNLPTGQEELQLEKGDLLAMTLSALLVIMPIVLVVLLVMVLIAGLWFW